MAPLSLVGSEGLSKLRFFRSCFEEAKKNLMDRRQYRDLLPHRHPCRVVFSFLEETKKAYRTFLELRVCYGKVPQDILEALSKETRGLWFSAYEIVGVWIPEDKPEPPYTVIDNFDFWELDHELSNLYREYFGD